MHDRIKRSTVAQAIQPALIVLAELRRELVLGNHAKALAEAEELAEILCGIEADVGSITPMSLFSSAI